MNLKQLEVFLAVAETGSFTRGADRSFLTQSTVSQHISSLEKEFDIKLLDRTSKGICLTEAGKILLKYTRQILSGTHEMVSAIQRFKGLEQVVLRIGGSNIPGSYIIPHFLPLFQQIHPGVAIHLAQGDSHEMLEKLKTEEIELALTGSLYEDDMVNFCPIGCDNIILVANSHHRWKGKGEISIDELREESFVFREEGSGTFNAVRTALANVGLNPEKLLVIARFGSNEAIKQAVCNGIGISFLSELSVRKEFAWGELYQVKIKEFSISRNFYLAFRRQRELSPAGNSFSKHICEWFSQLESDSKI